MAALGLVVQEMAQGIGQGISGSGVIQFVDPVTGQPQITGRYLGQSQGRDALQPGRGDLPDPRPARRRRWRTSRPRLSPTWSAMAPPAATRLREEMQIEFTIEDGRLAVLDAVKVARSARAGLRIAVALADDGIISRDEAVLRVEPRALSELLHPQVDPRGAARRVRHGHRRLARGGDRADRVLLGRGAGQRRAGRALHPGAPRNRARGYPRHAFGRRRC